MRFLNEYRVGNQPDLTKGVLLSSFKISSVAMLIAIGAIAIGANIKGASWLLVVAVSAYTAVNAGLMLGSQIARSLVSILMGKETGSSSGESAWCCFCSQSCSAIGSLIPPN